MSGLADRLTAPARQFGFGVIQSNPLTVEKWVPASAGMTTECAEMSLECAGMTMALAGKTIVSWAGIHD